MEIKKFITGQIIKAKILKEKAVKKLLCTNGGTGDEAVGETTGIVKAFLIAAAILIILLATIDGPVKTWLNNSISSWFPAGGETRPSV